MALSPISPIPPGAVPITDAARIGRSAAAGSTEGADGFGTALTSALDNLDSAQKTTDELARAAATGDLDRVEDLMVASTETQLTTQLTVAVRNRAIESFNEIMRMQL